MGPRLNFLPVPASNQIPEGNNRKYNPALELAALLYQWYSVPMVKCTIGPYGGMGPMDGRTAHLGWRWEATLLDHRREPRLDEKVTLDYLCLSLSQEAQAKFVVSRVAIMSGSVMIVIHPEVVTVAISSSPFTSYHLPPALLSPGLLYKLP